jgi:hypothetical protein
MRTKKMHKKRKSRKGGMFNVKNFDKSCRDNRKDFDRGKTLGYITASTPYNSTTYYPGVFNSNKTPVKNIMNCTDSFNSNETEDETICRQVRRELSKYERAIIREENHVYAAMNINNIKNCNKINYYLCTRIDSEFQEWAIKVLVINTSTRFSYTIDYEYYDANIPPPPPPQVQSRSLWDQWSNIPAPVQVKSTVPLYNNIRGEPMLTPTGNPIYEISLDNLELYLVN